ncbi:MAG: hypothetical protein K9J12_12580 [Melioribacteraceae bacterium]|nr:hypothetical protein [Melioribacteraceae bacterium]MCF8264168.1 hypothetical protein [Melioribacteraceae bacterium]MCF8413928.1 hypothetical protein [Melioribacteraceae bacterium]MCF8430518.1 hypothetical protein [Melioribacteraceae bacterium]
MAKKQTFADKSKGKGKSAQVNVKVIKTVKSEKGSYKFQERFETLDEIGKVSEIK